ncbi:MAG: DUF885 family protein [Planctomycetia bacterium]|nr:DUF885 family protein [Planctomycetia bacterium]
MAPYIEWYQADRGNLNRFYNITLSPNRQAQFRALYRQWLELLTRLPFDTYPQEAKVDYLLLKNYLTREQRQLEIRIKEQAEYMPLIQFAPKIIALEEARKRMEKIDPAKTAELLNGLKKEIDEQRTALSHRTKPTKFIANRASIVTSALQNHIRQWHNFHQGYDPLYSWWCEAPYKNVDEALGSYARYLRESVAGIRGGDEIVGDPIGKEMLLNELEYEMIPYSPEQLVTIANEEFAWCEAEMKKASQELGFGDDWKKALEKVKTLHEEPGKQPMMIRDLAWEAIDYVSKNDLVTVPELCKNTWRMEMMSPERQLVSPFFLGGEVIQVSFPTNSMQHEQKLMSMRGNNRYFSRATVHHELIPGHHLQGFMTARYRQHRQLFNTPFWVEGWALYWEMYLYANNFARTPEEKIGMLFWRMHRCARIIFSLSFHLGTMTPKECIDFLVDRVGHERDNATAEVRRSFAGMYGPLYQAAYMLGGLQVREMKKELVDSGKMKIKDFHDQILQQNSIPMELVRAAISNTPLTRDLKPGWKFYGEVKATEEKK